jgi:1-pyrroline-5-carboxylate dehydrogenase
VHFTGSTGVFNHIWGKIGGGVARYAQYPRLVGETGGKDFVIAHPSAERAALATALVRGAFEYQGQKCSAASRAYVPKSLWGDLKQRLGAELAAVKMGDVRDFGNFVGAVIDAPSFAKQKQAIEAARANPTKARVLFGGESDDSQGFFVQPTVIEAFDPAYDTMCTELFGPVLTIHVYDDARYEETWRVRTRQGMPSPARSSPTTARPCARRDALRFAAGNFYIGDSPPRRRRPATLRRQPRLGHERQGGLDPEPDALGLAAHDQGDLRAADGLALPVPGLVSAGNARLQPGSSSSSSSLLLPLRGGRIKETEPGWSLAFPAEPWPPLPLLASSCSPSCRCARPTCRSTGTRRSSSPTPRSTWRCPTARQRRCCPGSIAT